MFGRLLAVMIFVGLAIGFIVPMGDAPQPQHVSQIAAITPLKHVAAVKHPKPVETIIVRASDGHFYVDADVNGQLVHFVVDTGASMIALTKADALHAGISFNPGQFTIIGRGASGDVRGEEVNINRIAVDQHEAFDQRAVVLDDGLDVSLLGQSFLSKIGKVEIEGDRMTLR